MPERSSPAAQLPGDGLGAAGLPGAEVRPAPPSAVGLPPVASAAAASGPSGLRREILVRLRRDGPTSPDLLAARIGASRTGVLQQLRALEAARLVRHEPERHGVGRPRHVYEVTPDAQDLFPAGYDNLAAGLLEAIGAIGGDDLVEQVFAARRRQIGERVRREMAERLPPDASLPERVGALAVLQDEQGYLCEASLLPDGTLRIREHNCAILRVASGTRAACDAELDLFREILDAEIVRETHIASGDRTCTYRISARLDA